LDRTNSLFFWAISLQDSTDTGIPDWWWLAYLGQDTNVNAYALDPSGDGYTYLQDFQNGWVPGIFQTPQAPQNVTLNYNTVSGALLTFA
jgi:hypothetical protein